MDFINSWHISHHSFVRCAHSSWYDMCHSLIKPISKCNPCNNLLIPPRPHIPLIPHIPYRPHIPLRLILKDHLDHFVYHQHFKKSLCTVQITFIFIGQTCLVFGNCVCTCVTNHSNAFRTFLNWLKNSKRVWHEPKLHSFASFRKFWSVICERLVGLVSFKTNVSETAGQIHFSDNVRCNVAWL